jgi:hypothetical protein
LLRHHAYRIHAPVTATFPSIEGRAFNHREEVMRVFGKLCAAAVLAFTAACGGSDGVSEPVSVAGTYTLQSVNGGPLPFVIFDESGYKLEITAASYVLTSAGTFTNSATYRETESGTVTMSTETYSGQYTLTDSTVTFTDSDGEVYTATISGGNLLFNDDGLTAVFVK